MTDPNSEIPYIDDLTCTEVYAETTQVLFSAPGVVRIELGVNRWRDKAPVTVRAIVPVARFALQMHMARGLRDQLTNLIERFDQDAATAQALPASATKQ